MPLSFCIYGYNEGEKQVAFEIADIRMVRWYAMADSQNAADGRYEEIISVIGFDCFMKMCRYYGGTSVYIPTYEHASKDLKRNLIFEDYCSGNSNIDSLAKKYCVSARTVYRIINTKMKCKNK